MLDHAAQARARLAVSALGLAPWAGPDHAADYAAELARLEPSTATHALRDSRGRLWMVTKVSYVRYLLKCGDARAVVCESAREAAAMMEGE